MDILRHPSMTSSVICDIKVVALWYAYCGHCSNTLSRLSIVIFNNLSGSN